ncbi:MAG: hypothetical protein JST89_00945 [Cyanobacteria bacterium SZAS-4]|nr:hypothetical protein [Cyanobacteria bacterium SZAS-4]
MDNARPMTNDDGTQTKNQEKERVIAAITALKAQGADINPYTVSGEAQVPRSTLYRDPELMDLIYKERNGDDSSHMSNDEIQSKIAELEESNQALNEQIWDLEKQLESMTKLKQDAYVQGFQAGINEAAKRNAAGAGGEVTGSRPAVHVPDAVDITAETVAEPAVVAAPVAETAMAGVDYEPAPVAVGLGETNYKFTEPVTAIPKSNGEGKTSRKKVEENTGDYEPLSDSHMSGDFHFGDSLMAQDDSYELEEKVAPGEETGEHDIFDDIESVLSEQKGPASSSGADIDFTLHQERPEPQPEPVAAAPAGTVRKKKNFPDIDFGLSGDSDSHNGESHHEDAVAAGGREAAPADKHAASVAAQAGEESAVAQMTRDGDGIYNIARSGPTISSSAYNPLVELSWKDLQTVYNFSVASLKDYAKPGFGNEPGALGGTNFADSSTHEPKPVKPRQNQAALETSDSLDLPGPDPRRTGDRLQALSDPRNLLDSEPIVDLDALDIFDDLDDYVDLDKIEVISDVVSKPKAEEPSMGGDELRELIKGRIKQAADIPNEPSAPRMTTPPPAGGAATKDSTPGGGGGPRNKFIGGAKAGQEPPSAVPAFVVKTIPPEIRKSFMILGLKPEEATTKSVIEAWKKQIASPGVHPDLGGDTEAAVYLNTAKDQLVRWLDQQAPKLGKKFGQPHKPEPPKPKREED